jgi:hypothetical protein
MKQLEITEYLKIAALKAKQRAIALHYCQIAIDRDRLEAEAVASLKAKDDYTANFTEDL